MNGNPSDDDVDENREKILSNELIMLATVVDLTFVGSCCGCGCCCCCCSCSCCCCCCCCCVVLSGSSLFCHGGDASLKLRLYGRGG